MKALICGVSGQDGAYLAELLLSKGYEVYGTSRDANTTSFRNLNILGIKDKIKLFSMTLNDFRSVIHTLKQVLPDEVYNLSGQSSVSLSFELPVETLESISLGTLNLLEAIRFLEMPIKLYNAGSGECFGDATNLVADENTPFRPRSPYAVAKSAAFWEMVNYREAYGLFACNGILFNHESPLRPARFVTQKIILAALRIAEGRPKKLVLGNIDIQRDWGWAPEYVEAMWKMLQQKNPDDYVISTGTTHSLKTFIQKTFEFVGLDWKEFVETSAEWIRPSELLISRSNPDKALKILGWKAKYQLEDIIQGMVLKARELQNII